MNFIRRLIDRCFRSQATRKVPAYGYDPYNAEERMAFWKDLMEGRTIDSLIVKEDKTTVKTPEGLVVEPGVIGIVVEGVPIYIRPAAFGDAFGTFLVAADDSGKYVQLPENEL